MFWLIVFLPWLTLASSLAIRMQLVSKLLGAFWPLAFVASIFLREALLETPAERTKRIGRIRAPISKWWILGFPALLVAGSALLAYLPTLFPPRDSIRAWAIAGLLMSAMMAWDVVRQYRRGLA